MRYVSFLAVAVFAVSNLGGRCGDKVASRRNDNPPDTQAPDAARCIHRPAVLYEPPKRGLVQDLLARGKSATVFVHLDSRRPGVEVPPELRGRAHLVLQIGYGMANPIPDLVLDDNGFTGTLSFHDKPFHCRVPWTSVFAAVNEEERGAVWFEDVPADVRCAGD